MKKQILLAALALWAGQSQAEVSAPPLSETARLESLEKSVAELRSYREGLHVEGFGQLRLDDERKPSSALPAGGSAGGQSGLYVRRAEFKFTGKLSPHMGYALGYDFAENKLKDFGVELKKIPLMPWASDSSLSWDARLGQFRVPFGVIPQMSSSALALPERPMVYGGRNLAGGRALVKERVMGAQVRQKGSLATILGYDFQAGAFNNALDDQAAGQNKLATAFAAQLEDQDWSPAARLALSLDFLASLMPDKSKLVLGASYLRDTQNAKYMAQLASDAKFDEIYGLDAKLDLAQGRLVALFEYVRLLDDIGSGGLSDQSESWFSELALDILPWLKSERTAGEALKLAVRLEDQNEFKAVSGEFDYRVSRLGLGLQWCYLGGKNQTSLTYFVDARDQMFGGDGRGPVALPPGTMLVLQQQFAFEN